MFASLATHLASPEARLRAMLETSDGRTAVNIAIDVNINLDVTVRGLEEGIGSVEDIDKAMQLGCGYPMGPLTLLDFVGLDTTYFIANIMFEEYREKRFAPPPLLKQMVLAGRLGRKSGRGFYNYAKR